ncbi:MAG: CpsD/CapB family tyrosine-protein kinase [Clostridiales bacterium]|nr:CpsD/CapB family tyrosine-protein kinase [Clostridiales bacterium]
MPIESLSIAISLEPSPSCVETRLGALVEPSLVSSAVANMGIALARGGKRVLLIDCDLRKPQLHEKFRIAKNSVTSFYGFETKSERRKCIIEVFSGLYVLPFINDIDKNHTFFQTSGFSNAVHDFESEYDIIIFDSAPVYDVTDSLSLVGLSDAVIMVIKQDEALISEHIKSTEKLSAVGGRFLGSIFNDVKYVMQKSRYIDKYSYHRFTNNGKTGQLPG